MGGGAGGKLLGLSRYPKGFASDELFAGRRLDGGLEGVGKLIIDVAISAAGGGDGVVPSVDMDCSRESIESPDCDSESDDPDSSRDIAGIGASAAGAEWTGFEPEEDILGPSVRRRTLGEGPSFGEVTGGNGGPRRNEPTAVEAASKSRRLLSSSLRRFAELAAGEGSVC